MGRKSFASSQTRRETRSVGRTIEIPDHLRRRAAGGGSECERWLDQLPGLIAELERRWSIEVGGTREAGTSAFVADATKADGCPVVVKMAMPSELDGWESLDRAARMLELADGRGCVRALAYDPELHALMTERLGPMLAESTHPLPERLRLICAALHELWATEPALSLPSGAEQAAKLSAYVGEAWRRLARPCPARVVDCAGRYADSRARAHRPERAVLAHGDAHVWNALEDPTSPGGYRLIDPDPVIAEPEYDVAISMREYTDPLLGGDPVRLSLSRAAFLAGITGTDRRAIFEWGYLQVVSNGLILMEGAKDPSLGQSLLRLASLWTDI